MAIIIEIPPDIEEQLQEEWPDLYQGALEGFLVEAYRQKKLSSFDVGRILGHEDRWETLEFLSGHGVYPNYDLEDYEDDLRTLAKMGRLPLK